MQFNSKTYKLDSSTANSATYRGPGQTLSIRDQLQLSRQRIKTSAAYSGTSRGNATLTRTVPLTGALTPTGVASLSVDPALPVGMADADQDALIADFRGFVASSEFATWVKSRTFIF
mgnify:CR=1 FL=1